MQPGEAARTDHPLRRRGGLARALRAQQKARPVIGLLGFARGPGEPWMAPFYQGLGETGDIEGQNLAIEIVAQRIA